MDPRAENQLSDNLAMAMDKLVRFLARRDHSELELQEKLGKSFTQEVVDRAIETARERKWLPDPQELAERVASALGAKRKGQLYIQNYLRKKGLPPVPRQEEQELEKARDLLKSRFDCFDNWLDHEMKQKAYRYLANRGFEDQIIKKVLYEKS
ncbi:MAG: RecX family transcriptional regulator [Bdellovibrionaceae bacterium]|nr:RecX family transcriptional regulator [Bdellovibrionales bacterium]MCB9084898.1 RecX family transcriptional regulator [Pseudobdellovibrionaceae bacterium]